MPSCSASKQLEPFRKTDVARQRMAGAGVPVRRWTHPRAIDEPPAGAFREVRVSCTSATRRTEGSALAASQWHVSLTVDDLGNWFASILITRTPGGSLSPLTPSQCRASNHGQSGTGSPRRPVWSPESVRPHRARLRALLLGHVTSDSRTHDTKSPNFPASRSTFKDRFARVLRPRVARKSSMRA